MAKKCRTFEATVGTLGNLVFRCCPIPRLLVVFQVHSMLLDETNDSEIVAILLGLAF